MDVAKFSVKMKILYMLLCARFVFTLRCRVCDKVRTLNECVTSVTCGENQVCFIEKYMTEQRQILYSGGCRASNMCPYNEIPSIIGKRRRNIPAAEQLTCSKCCYGAHDCNVKLCVDQVAHRPPKIVTQSDDAVLYIPGGQSFDLPCIADGRPDPVYYWKFNGVLFSPSGNDGTIVQKRNEGSLHFVSHNEKEEGFYQCFANNGYGVSPSRIFRIVTVKFVPMPRVPSTVTRTTTGTPVTLPCTPPRSSPPADLQWVLSDGSGMWQDVHYSNRVIMDDEGRLRFLNVMKTDGVAGKPYRCMTSNSVTGQHSFGSEHVLDVLGNELRVPAAELWTSPSFNIFLKTETLKLTCLFSGNPTPNVFWTKLHDNSFPSNRTTYHNFGYTLQITDLDYNDSGKYECSGINAETLTAVTKQFVIAVEASPYWTIKPIDVNGVVNGAATFLCRAEGVPNPGHIWYINGIPLTESRDPRIYQSQRILQPDIYNLTFTQLTADDSMNIQCNVSNIHGYVFADVYLNVI